MGALGEVEEGMSKSCFAPDSIGSSGRRRMPAGSVFEVVGEVDLRKAFEI